jgi:hypothetical protein
MLESLDQELVHQKQHAFAIAHTTSSSAQALEQLAAFPESRPHLRQAEVITQAREKARADLKKLRLGHEKSLKMQLAALQKLEKNQHLGYHFPEEMAKHLDYHETHVARLNAMGGTKIGESWMGKDGKEY